MLIRVATLKQIKNGEVSLAFRRWRKPTVKTGGTLKTAVGELSILNVDKCTLRSISPDDARRAGFATKAALVDELKDREGDVYRIALAYAGADPRIALREDAELDDEQYAAIHERLNRYDAASRLGDWTLRVLETIEANPERSAAELAPELGYEKKWFKGNVRKLKALGLTISHAIGYTLSPRGAAVLAGLRDGRE